MGGPLKTFKKFRKEVSQSRKKGKGDPLVLSAFANARTIFWQKQELEPATAGFP